MLFSNHEKSKAFQQLRKEKNGSDTHLSGKGNVSRHPIRDFFNIDSIDRALHIPLYYTETTRSDNDIST